MNNADVHVYPILPSAFPYEYAYATILSRKRGQRKGLLQTPPMRTGASIHQAAESGGLLAPHSRIKEGRSYDTPALDWITQ